MPLNGDPQWGYGCNISSNNGWITTGATTSPYVFYPVSLGAAATPEPEEQGDLDWLREQVDEIRDLAFAA